ncbi:MAG TPA: UPF0175 family protein [Candidatus Deferrimicrobium sp.]|nr:UPF0175 family protein [Candidatus Deferrimicrobium sp.]
MWQKERAIDFYKQRSVTLWKASQIAGISLREMIDELMKHKIPLNITVEDLEEDLLAARKAEKNSVNRV